MFNNVGRFFVALMMMFCFALSVEAAEVEPRVVGGSDAERSYPWMASLYRIRGLSFRCGATLISSRFVLTAAHCVSTATLAEEPLGVWVGAEAVADVTRAGLVGVAAVVVHPRYDPDTLENDIALLRLETAVDVEPVALATLSADQLFQAGQEGVVLGLGLTEVFPEERFPDTLQQGDVPIIDRAECAAIYLEQGYLLADSMFCAGRDGDAVHPDVDACIGDSGGPLLYHQGGDQYLQAGIISFGDSNCDPGTLPGVYVDTAYYQDFIEQVQLGALYGVDIGFTGVQVPTAVSVDISNWTDQPFSIEGVIEQSDRLSSIDYRQCDNVEPGEYCEVQLVVNAVEGRYLDETVLLSVQGGAVALEQIEVVVIGWALEPMDASDVVADDRIRWYSGGHAAWEVTDAFSYTGGFSLRSGAVRYPEVSLLMAYVDGPTFFSYVDRVVGDLESDDETLELFLKKGQQVVGSGLSLSDDVWTFRQYELGADQYQLIWRFQRLGLTADAYKAAYIDSVVVAEASRSDPTQEALLVQQATSGGAIDYRVLLVILVGYMGLSMSQGCFKGRG